MMHEQPKGNYILTVDTAAAEHNLGAMYVKGIGVAQDLSEAIRWYERAAAKGQGGSDSAAEADS